MSNFGKL